MWRRRPETSGSGAECPAAAELYHPDISAVGAVSSRLRAGTCVGCTSAGVKGFSIRQVGVALQIHARDLVLNGRAEVRLFFFQPLRCLVEWLLRSWTSCRAMGNACMQLGLRELEIDGREDCDVLRIEVFSHRPENAKEHLLAQQTHFGKLIKRFHLIDVRGQLL